MNRVVRSIDGVLKFFVVLAGFVSVSLYVSVDSNKAFMKVILERQPEMMHAESATKLRVRAGSEHTTACLPRHFFAPRASEAAIARHVLCGRCAR